MNQAKLSVGMLTIKSLRNVYPLVAPDMDHTVRNFASPPIHAGKIIRLQQSFSLNCLGTFAKQIQQAKF